MIPNPNSNSNLSMFELQSNKFSSDIYNFDLFSVIEYNFEIRKYYFHYNIK